MASAERQLDPGAHLFHRGDEVASLFAVREGRVDLVRGLENGSAITLQRAEAGMVLAEASVFSGAYHCDGVAASASLVLAVPKPRFRERLRSDADFAELWTGHLARQVQQARFRSEVLALRTVAERLDMWLAWQDGALPPRGRWNAIATELGVSPEALYRELARRRSG